MFWSCERKYISLPAFLYNQWAMYSIGSSGLFSHTSFKHVTNARPTDFATYALSLPIGSRSLWINLCWCSYCSFLNPLCSAPFSRSFVFVKSSVLLMLSGGVDKLQITTCKVWEDKFEHPCPFCVITVLPKNAFATYTVLANALQYEMRFSGLMNI